MNTVYKQGFYDRVPLYMPRACPRQLYKGRGRTRVQYTVFILCFIVYMNMDHHMVIQDIWWTGYRVE